MKHLLLYEDYRTPHGSSWDAYKFKDGDFVKFKEDNIDYKIYQVVNASMGWFRIESYELREVEINKFGKIFWKDVDVVWKTIDELEKVDKEIVILYLKAKKYNI